MTLLHLCLSLPPSPFFCLPLSLSLSLSVSVSVSLSLCACLCLCLLSLFFSVSISACLPTCLSVSLCLSVSVSLSVKVSVSVCLSLPLSLGADALADGYIITCARAGRSTCHIIPKFEPCKSLLATLVLFRIRRIHFDSLCVGLTLGISNPPTPPTPVSTLPHPRPVLLFLFLFVVVICFRNNTVARPCYIKIDNCFLTLYQPFGSYGYISAHSY